MATLYMDVHVKPVSLYKDRRYAGDPEDREKLLKRSTTLYVGNLSFYTTEEQVFELFSKAGEVKRIVMGLDKFKKTPCGFCFVEYFTRRDAEASVHFLSGLKLDERIIRVDYDVGFSPGRQFGRGRSGGQVRDEYRTDYDPGRGGFGHSSGMSGMEMWGNSSHSPAPPTRQSGPSNGYGSGPGPRPPRGRGRFPDASGGGSRGGYNRPGGGYGRQGPGFVVGVSYGSRQNHRPGPPRGGQRRASYPGTRHDERPYSSGMKRRREHGEDYGRRRMEHENDGYGQHRSQNYHDMAGDHQNIDSRSNREPNYQNEQQVAPNVVIDRAPDSDLGLTPDHAPGLDDDGRPSKQMRLSPEGGTLQSIPDETDRTTNARFDRGKKYDEDAY